MQQLSKSPQLNHKKSGEISIYFHSDSSTLEDSLDIIASKIAEIKSGHIKSSNYPDTIKKHKSNDNSNATKIIKFTDDRNINLKQLSSIIQHIAENNYQLEGSSVDQERRHAL